MRRKLLIIKTLGFKNPISLNKPDNNNEMSQIEIYLKFLLSNKVKSIPLNRYDKKLDFVVTEKKIIE